MHVCWLITMQDFKGLQGDKSKFWANGKYWLSIMCGPPTKSLSKYYDLSNIFAVHSCLQPIKSEKWHFHMWRKCFVQSRRTCQKYWVSDERNPTFVYKIYHKKRPNSMLTTEASFYLSINYSKDSGRCWFKAGAVGVNKAGLEERPWLTNHSTRKTTLQ